MKAFYKTVRLAILFTGMLILSCQEEPQYTSATHKQTYQTFITADKPEALAILQQVLNTSVTNGRTQSTTGGELTIAEGVLLDSANYSQYAFEYTNTGNRFENLIAIVEDGVTYAYILQYDPDSLWLASNNGIVDLEKFTGYIRQLDLNRAIISENYIQGGKSMIDLYDASTASSGGRAENVRCCWQTVKSTTTSLPMVLIKCDDGSQLEIFGEDFGHYAACSGNNGSAGGDGGDGPSVNPTTPTPSPTSPQPFNPRPTPIKGGGNGTGTGPGKGLGITPPRGLLSSPRGPIVIGLTKKIYYLGSYCVDCIENQLKDPCLKKVADKVLNPGIASTYNKLIQDIFNESDKVNLIIREGDAEDMKDTTKLHANGWTEPIEKHDGIVDVIIELNSNQLAGVSEEYIASTIYHEAFHAIVHYFDRNKWFFKNTPEDDHEAMFSKYIDLVASGLQSAYPSLSTKDAQALILKGTLKYRSDWEKALEKILFMKNLSMDVIDATERKYRLNISGTPCK